MKNGELTSSQNCLLDLLRVRNGLKFSGSILPWCRIGALYNQAELVGELVSSLNVALDSLFYIFGTKNEIQHLFVYCCILTLVVLVLEADISWVLWGTQCRCLGHTACDSEALTYTGCWPSIGWAFQNFSWLVVRHLIATAFLSLVVLVSDF